MKFVHLETKPRRKGHHVRAVRYTALVQYRYTMSSKLVQVVCRLCCAEMSDSNEHCSHCLQEWGQSVKYKLLITTINEVLI